MERPAREAIRLDPRLDDAFDALGSALFFGRWDLNGALDAFRKAVEINPRHAHAQRLRADLLCILGRFAEEVALVALQSLEPTSSQIAVQKAVMYGRWRKYAQAAAEAERAVALDPNSSFAQWTLGLARQQQGRLEEAESCSGSFRFRLRAVRSHSRICLP